MADTFIFFETNDLCDEQIFLKLEVKHPANPEKGFVPSYGFAICSIRTGMKIGEISLRVGFNSNIYFGGNIGYSVMPEHRGKHYAAKACLLILSLARKHNMEKLIITCNPDNIASRRTCELAGAKLTEIVDLPPENDMYQEGERQKCIYEVIL